MQILTFETTSPYDHVPRALDILRTMGFELGTLSVCPNERGFVVDLKYIQSGMLSVHTFIERMAQALGMDSGNFLKASS